MKRGDYGTDVMLRNEYHLKSGSTEFTIVTTSDFEQEYKVVDLPDGNSVPGKRSEPFEFDFEIPFNNNVDVMFMEQWIEDVESFGSSAMRDLTLYIPSTGNLASYTINLEKCFPRKSSIPGKDAQSDEAVNFKGTMRCSKRGKPTYV